MVRVYVYSFGIIIAYEVTAACLVVEDWPNKVHIAVCISMMLVIVIALNVRPVRAYAETKLWFASIKIIMVIELIIILSVVLFLGGGPNHQIPGFHYWKT